MSFEGMFDGYKSGFVTLIGRPNAGKSTLLNAVIGKKIAITSDTAQTTRHRFRAVKTTDEYQLVIVDTPGLHKPHDALGEELNTSALKALEDVDVVAMLIDSSKPVGTGDEWVANQLKRIKTRKLLVLSKTDLTDDATVDAQLEAAASLADWDGIVRCSAVSGEGVPEFESAVVELMPEGPQWFPEDMETDQPIEVVVAEFIREKILRSFRDEIPHAIGVGMIIGKKGAAIKRIGTEAREDLEHILGTRVYLDLSVKVRKNWRRDANQIRRFGYGEGA